MSLRHLLTLVAIVALAFTSLRFASPLWTFAMLAATLILLLSTILIAAVDRGRERAMALGFIAFIFAYFLLNYFSANSKPPRYRLPTATLLWHLQDLDGFKHVYDVPTGQELRFDPDRERYVKPDGSVPASTEHNGFHIMAVGNCWFALLCGYIGGHFGRLINAAFKKPADGPPGAANLAAPLGDSAPENSL